MSDQRGTPSLLTSWPAVMFFIVIASGVYLSRQPLTSSRPPTPPVPLVEDEVNARLWQDPFRVAREHHTNSQGHGVEEYHNIKQLRQRIWRELQTDVARQEQARRGSGSTNDGAAADEPPVLHVLCAMVSGGDSAEENERRLRSRFAVLAALRASGYTPEDPEHIGYFQLSWTTTSDVRESYLRNQFNIYQQGSSNFQSDSMRAFAEPTPSRLAQRPSLVEKIYRSFAWRPGGPSTDNPSGATQSDAAARAAGTRPLLVPYEWFQREDLLPAGSSHPRSKYVVLLWLDGAKFAQFPLRRLDKLTAELLNRDELGKSLQSLAEAKVKLPVKVNIIGPHDSTTLRAMLDERYPESESRAQANLPPPSHPAGQIVPLTLYSPWSTAEPQVLLHGEDLASGVSLEGALRAKGVEFRRTIGTDGQLVEEIIQELQRRGVDVLPNGRADEVALIAEWDTFYGRAFPLTFAAVMRSGGAIRDSQRFALRLQEMLDGDHKTFPPNLRTYSYIRGVDGNVPGDKTDQEPVTPPGTKALTEDQQSRHPERPTGPSQLDYARRMADQLSAYYNQPGRKRLRAIGIMGSDVYDKLLLLQALREQFTDVLFFTTDLDARMFHQSNYPWTRNVLVASTFGLALKSDYQNGVYHGGIASFRDSYQTSVFFACRVALGMHKTSATHDASRPQTPRAIGPDDLPELTSQPRLFEIGRDEAVDISVPPIDMQPGNDVHPPPREELDRSSLSWLIVIVMSLLFVATLLACQVSTTVKRQLWRKMFTGRRELVIIDVLIVVASVIALVLVFTIYSDHYWRPGGEPFSVTAGVSTWPYVVLRLVAVALGSWFVIRGGYDLRENAEKIQRRYYLKPARGRAGPCWPPWRPYRVWWWLGASVYAFLHHLRLIGIGRWTLRSDENTPIFVGRLWIRYERLGHWFNRLGRTVPMAATYLGLSLLIALVFQFPSHPYRGNYNWVFGVLVRNLSGLVLVILTFFVVDATLLAYRFIRNLGAPPSIYPTATLDKVARDRNMDWNDIPEWLDVQIIADRTESVGTLIYYPFIVLLLMYASRLSYFDNFNWPLSTIVFYTLLALYALGCAVALRYAAEHARRRALDRLRGKLVGITCDPQAQERAKQIELTIQEIEANRRGAFSPITETPILRAALIPSGGVALLTFLEMWVAS